MGAVLSQLDLEGVEHPVCYASRSCNPAKQNYSSFDGECLAVVWATSHFRSYLFGNSFTLITDHEPLKWLMTTQKLTEKMARWSLLLQEYDFDVVHRAGVENTNADCLSRYPLESTKAAPILDWTKGEILPPATYFALMADLLDESGAIEVDKEKDIWHDIDVLQFLQTHKYCSGSSAMERDKIYRRAKGYRWQGSSVFKMMQHGALVVVPRPQDRQDLVIHTHRTMGHFGVQRTVDRLKKDYWWREMGDTVV